MGAVNGAADCAQTCEPHVHVRVRACARTRTCTRARAHTHSTDLTVLTQSLAGKRSISPCGVLGEQQGQSPLYSASGPVFPAGPAQGALVYEVRTAKAGMWTACELRASVPFYVPAATSTQGRKLPIPVCAPVSP